MSDESIIFHVGTDTERGIRDSRIPQLSRQPDVKLECLSCHDSATDDDDQLKVTRATAARKRRIYRGVLKSQREELRQQVADLSDEVSRIKQMKETAKTRFDAEQKPEFWFWKSTAAQQHHQRMLVEEEHEALKRAVDIQTTYIKSLEVVRQERSGSAVNLMCLQYLDDEETAVFEEFLQELDVDFSNDQNQLLDFSL